MNSRATRVQSCNGCKLQIARTLQARAILLSLKFYLCLLTPNCSRNYVITYTNLTGSQLSIGGQMHK